MNHSFCVNGCHTNEVPRPTQNPVQNAQVNMDLTTGIKYRNFRTGENKVLSVKNDVIPYKDMVQNIKISIILRCVIC